MLIRTLTFLLFAAISPLATAEESIRGLIKAQDQAVLSSEVAATVARLPFRSGDNFAKGDVLVEFDCGLYAAQLKAAEASQQLRQSELANAEQLLAYKAISPLEVEVARNELQQADARYEIESLRVAGCQIQAPYQGRVIDVLTNEHQTVSRGTELMSILSDAQLEIELIVPSDWLGWLEIGHRFEFSIDETGKTHDASIARIGAMVDPVSQTIVVIAVFDGSRAGVLPGMSGNALFQSRP